MSLTPEQLQQLEEISNLPVDDPQLTQFVATLSAMDPQVQNHWRTLMRENELLRKNLHHVNVPSDLHAKLLALPDRPLAVLKPSLNSIKIPWPIAAAVILIVCGVGGYYLWNSDSKPQYVALVPPPQAAIDSITALAVNHYFEAAALDIESDKPEIVRQALQSKIGNSMPFPVSMPTPDANFRLIGGRVCTFGSGPAVETRWKNGENVYALFQFAPATFGLPQTFLKQIKFMPPTQPALIPCQVVVWPGPPDGICTWAVVCNQSAPNETFSGGTY